MSNIQLRELHHTLNKKDIANIRKQFKLDNDLLTVSHIYNVYVRKESSEVFHEESHPFEMLDREQQELFLNNFKKVLTGQVDVRLFEVKFKEDVEDHTRHILHNGLQTDDVEEWKDEMHLIVEKMFQDVQYENDMVITFIRAKYLEPTRRNNADTETSNRDDVYAFPFILCSINRTDLPKRKLIFDYIEKEFKSNMEVDPVINLTSPVGGFLFPTFTDHASDVNRVLYATGRANKPDFHFIEEVLNGEDIMTAQADKAVFEEIVKDVVGDGIDTQMLANVYEEINRIKDEEEELEEETPTLDYKDVENVLKISGVEDVTEEQVETAFQKVVDDDKYELKASSIVPNYTSKSIKIKTKVTNISISPEDLKYVRQVNIDGKRCLLIEVDDETMIDGFKLIPEATLNPLE